MTHRIKTAIEHPPIPCPPIWRAWSDNLGEDCSPYGEGRTEAEAIADLERQLADEDRASLKKIEPLLKELTQ